MDNAEFVADMKARGRCIYCGSKANVKHNECADCKSTQHGAYSSAVHAGPWSNSGKRQQQTAFQKVLGYGVAEPGGDMRGSGDEELDPR